MTLVLQAPTAKGRYASKLLHNQYQVMEHALFKGTFQIYDLTQIGSWKKFIIRQPSRREEESGDPITFSSKDEAHAFVDKLAKGSKAEKLRMTHLRSASPQATKVPGGKRSMAGVTRQLLLDGKLTDDQIYDQVLKEFPTFRRTSVDWYRNELRSKGVLK